MSERVPVPSRVVLVDKPEGWTSFDVVKRARRGVRAKVGHAGTLDPFATGLLLLLVGRATRLVTPHGPTEGVRARRAVRGLLEHA